jgi:putative ABC transport system permease protein
MRSFFRRLRWLTQRRDRELELRKELQFHLQEETEARREQGLTGDEARIAARRELGNLTLVEEDTRTAWGWTRFEQLARDAGFGLRQIRRNPAFSAIAIATLALGIGGITAIFSAVDAILIRPLPYPDADRLVMIWDNLNRDGSSKSFPAPAEWLEWRRLNTVFSDIAATQRGAATLSGDSEPEQVAARKATANLWNVLGVKPLIGRAFTEEEDLKGVQVAVISHGLWQRRYGSSPDILGRKISLNDSPYEVIGVMPRDFYFLPARDIDIWMPASFPAWMRTNFSWHNAQVVARLKPGVTLEQAKESMGALSLQITAKDFRGPHSVVVSPLREDLAGKTQTALVVLLCASAALLLIACVNLANLLMSRGAVRGREVVVRTALGAGRGRLLAQFLTESLVLAALGAAAGLALALPAMRFLEMLVPETMGTVRLTLDWRVLVFSAAIAIAATLTFGLAPALRESRLAPQDGLREAGRGTAGVRSHWFQHSLIVIETALAVVLVTSGGVLLQTLQHLQNTDIGMQREKLLTFEAPLFRYKELEKQVAFVNAMLEKIRAVPGVVDAAATSRLPLGANTPEATFYLLPGQTESNIPGQVAQIRVVTRDYFTTIGARLREGRFFEASDRRSDSRVAIVNESFASRNFPDRSAIGAKLKFGELNERGYWYTIIGVTKEVREGGIEDEQRLAVYRLHEQADQVLREPRNFVVRTAVEPTSVVSAIRQAIWSVDRNQPIWLVQTVEEIMEQQLSMPAQSTALLSAFALLALLLASLGLYGVLSYAVTQRTNEIGLRMALGATSSDILISFGKRGLALTLAGLAIGLVLTAVAARSMTTLLYGFHPDYVPIAASASLVFLGVAAFACLVPSRRAARVDPVIALRNE